MIVCSCNVFSDVDVRRCLRGVEAPRNPRAVYDCLGCSPKCGTCVDTIRNIMKTERLLAGEARTPCLDSTEPLSRIA
jgi:bacterioferritin-associated ferredoxin